MPCKCTKSKKGGAELDDLSQKEKQEILRTLWNDRQIKEFFRLGTQNREWYDVLVSLEDTLSYAFPKFKFLDAFLTPVGDLVPFHWGNDRNTFHEYINRFIVMDSEHIVYASLIGKTVPLYEYLFECMSHLYQDEFDETDNQFRVKGHTLLPELKRLSQRNIDFMTLILSGQIPPLENSLEDQRSIWKVAKSIGIQKNKVYTLPTLLMTVFKSLVLSIQNSRNNSARTPLTDAEAKSYLYKQVFLD